MKVKYAFFLFILTFLIVSGHLLDALAETNISSSDVFSAAMTPDGNNHALGRRGAFSLKPRNEEMRRITLEGDSDAKVNAIAFSRDSRQLMLFMGTSTGNVWLYNVNGKRLQKLGAHAWEVVDIEFDRDGKMAVSAASDGNIKFWDIQKEKEIFSAIETTGFTPPGGITAVALSPNGKFLATGTTNGSVQLWSVSHQSLPAKPLRNVKVPPAHTYVKTIAFSPNNTMITAGAEDGSLFLLKDFSKPGTRWELIGKQDSAITTVAFSPDIVEIKRGISDSATIAIGREDGTLLLRDTQTHAKRNLDFSQLSMEILSIAFSDDGSTLRSVDASEELRSQGAPVYGRQKNTPTLTATEKPNNPPPGPADLPPHIEIVSPKLEANKPITVWAGRVDVTVRVTHEMGIKEVEINGSDMIPTADDANLFTREIMVVGPRVNSFPVNAWSKNGKQGKKVFLFQRKEDKSAPKIVIDEKSPKFIKGKITDGESGVASAEINRQRIQLKPDGSFEHSLEYLFDPAGKYTITATDKAGISADFPVEIPIGRTTTATRPGDGRTIPDGDEDSQDDLVDRSDPRLVLRDAELADNRRKTTNTASFTLKFLVFDDSPIKAVVVKRKDGTTYPVSEIGKGDYGVDLRLNEGENTFEIQVTDKWDNHELQTLYITRVPVDTEGPQFISLSVGQPTLRGAVLTKDPIAVTANAPILVTSAAPTLRGRLYDDSGIRHVKIAVNDEAEEELGLRAGARDENEKRFEKVLSLDYGQNQIRITATDIQGNQVSSEFIISQRPDRDGKDFALFFATNKYDGKKNTKGDWTNLKTAIADAEKIEKKLRENYGFKTRVIKDPTGRTVLSMLVAYQNRFIDGTGAEFAYEDGSQLLLYFAGHGYYDKLAESGYLITRDSEPPAIDPGQSTAIEHGRLRKAIDLINCKRVLVLMDTCFGGTFDPKYTPRASELMRSLTEDGTLLEQINVMLRMTARWCVTSASSEYVADSTSTDPNDTDANSPFATAFMAALDTHGGADNLLKLDEIWEKVQESRNHPIYDEAEREAKVLGKRFERPEPRKGQFGANQELYQESDFLFFPKVIRQE